jgi:predicted amidophosphoribosyltransferase
MLGLFLLVGFLLFIYVFQRVVNGAIEYIENAKTPPLLKSKEFDKDYLLRICDKYRDYYTGDNLDQKVWDIFYKHRFGTLEELETEFEAQLNNKRYIATSNSSQNTQIKAESRALTNKHKAYKVDSVIPSDFSDPEIVNTGLLKPDTFDSENYSLEDVKGEKKETKKFESLNKATRETACGIPLLATKPTKEKTKQRVEEFRCTKQNIKLCEHKYASSELNKFWFLTNYLTSKQRRQLGGEELSEIILKFKYSKGDVVHKVVEIVAPMIATSLNELFGGNAEILIVRALSHTELKPTGESPLDVLGQRICDFLRPTSIYCPKLLSKTKHTPSQKELSRNERFKNQDAYQVDDSRLKENTNILVLDDITTTGATAYGIAKKLKASSLVNEVFFFAVAKTLQDKELHSYKPNQDLLKDLTQTAPTDPGNCYDNVDLF